MRALTRIGYILFVKISLHDCVEGGDEGGGDVVEGGPRQPGHIVSGRQFQEQV